MEILLGGCAQICDANARFCPKCGNETNYYFENLLCDYKKYDTNKEIMKTLWQEILAELKNNKKVMLYANLIQTELSEINEFTICINFKNCKEFTKILISKEENIKVLRDIINTKYKKEMKIKLYDLKEKKYFYEDTEFEEFENFDFEIDSTDDLPF